MTEDITLYLTDWQYNAGIVGLVNILGRENITIAEQSITFSSDLLNDFQDKYFNFFIDTYQKTLSWDKIISYQKKIDKFEENNFENFTEKELDYLNKYIKDTVKKYMIAPSYVKAYPLIDPTVDPLLWIKDLNTVGKLTKKETFTEKRIEIIAEVQVVFEKLKPIIAYCNSELGRKYLAGKNVIYTVICKGWSGVSFLNSQPKIPDMYLDYESYFLSELPEYQAEKEKYKFQCSNCNQPMKNYKNDLNFLNQTGFDTNRKTSHVWDFNNDIGVCPMCKMVYSCLPAGFTYAYQQGMFINANTSVKMLVDVNQVMQKNVLNPIDETALTETSPYVALVHGIQGELNKGAKYDLAEIQVVRYEDESYRFSLLSKPTLKVIYESKKQLDSLIKAGFREINTSFSLYKLVMQRLFNNENLFTLIHKTLVYKLSNVSNLYYQSFHIDQMLTINTYFLRGIGKMEQLSTKQVSYARYFGENFKELYKKKSNERKIIGISYRLLNALKTSNRDLFMDVLLNCCSYLGIEVPALFLKSFESDEQFKTLGYSFVSGMIGLKSATPTTQNTESAGE